MSRAVAEQRHQLSLLWDPAQKNVQVKQQNILWIISQECLNTQTESLHQSIKIRTNANVRMTNINVLTCVNALSQIQTKITASV